MFICICFEKVYSFWDRIGDLIASFFPDRIKGDVYFSKIINLLEKDYQHNLDFVWLKKFVDNEYTVFNQQRISVVHYISNNTQQKWEQLQQINDYEKSKALTDKIISYPIYFKKMNELCKIGFEKTLNFLERINQVES